MLKKLYFLNLINVRSYAKSFNYLGRKNVDTKQPEHKEIGMIPEDAEDVSDVSGVPKESITDRVAFIHLKAKNCMQSGTYGLNKWYIEFDHQENWKNPLMGWESTGDPISNVEIEFSDKEDAIIYCKRMGYKYEIHENKSFKKIKPKSYSDNFSWNKKTRISTK
jgi:NADH dehydrogenase (ubiquinone) Fe-S protein 4